MKITYFGHSCFMIENNDARIIIDPFYNKAEFAQKPDFVIVTHGHQDHMGNALELSKNGAKFIGIFELCNYVKSQDTEIVTQPMNIGGFFDFGAFRMKLTDATHSSSVDGIHNIGRATGVIIDIDGKIIYHAGDTGLFSDMGLLGARHDIDIAMLPIGGLYTMDIDDAIYAAGLLKPKIAIPMHYNTFPVIQADPLKFTDAVVGGTVFSAGETKEF